MAMRDYIAGGVTGRLWNESRGEGKIYLKIHGYVGCGQCYERALKGISFTKVRFLDAWHLV